MLLLLLLLSGACLCVRCAVLHAACSSAPQGSDSSTPEWLCTMQVKAVDTNGAGDTFATAYMLAIATHTRNPGAPSAHTILPGCLSDGEKLSHLGASHLALLSSCRSSRAAQSWLATSLLALKLPAMLPKVCRLCKGALITCADS